MPEIALFRFLYHCFACFLALGATAVANYPHCLLILVVLLKTFNFPFPVVVVLYLLSYNLKYFSLNFSLVLSLLL